MVEVSKELWDRMITEIRKPWWHYMSDGYTKGSKYYMLESLYEQYMMDDDDLPF